MTQFVPLVLEDTEFTVAMAQAHPSYRHVQAVTMTAVWMEDLHETLHEQGLCDGWYHDLVLSKWVQAELDLTKACCAMVN